MKLDTARIFVSNVVRSKPFYQQILGLTMDVDGTEDGYFLLSSNGINIVVENSEPVDETTGEPLVGRFTGLSFSVANIFETHNRLSTAGVEFLDPPEQQAWGGYIASFKDIDGNILTLVQSQPELLAV